MTTKFDEEIKFGPPQTGVLPIILQRWSPRAFASTAVEPEQLKQLFLAGIWAASSYNEQPWRFVVGVKGTPTWEKIFQALAEPNQAWAGGAPVLFAAFAKKTFSHNGQENLCAVHDVGAASAMIGLEATALKLYVHGMGGFDRQKLSALLAVSDDFVPVACWALGHLGNPSELPEQLQEREVAVRTRKNLSEVVFESWNEAAAWTK
jgi:nitroreductase